MVVYICQCYPPNLSPLPFPCCAHRSILYVCVCIHILRCPWILNSKPKNFSSIQQCCHSAEHQGQFTKKKEEDSLRVSLYSVVSESLQPQGLQPARLLYPGYFPGKNARVGCHFLLQEIFLISGSNQPRLMYPTLADGFFTTTATWEAHTIWDRQL